MSIFISILILQLHVSLGFLFIDSILRYASHKNKRNLIICVYYCALYLLYLTALYYIDRSSLHQSCRNCISS